MLKYKTGLVHEHVNVVKDELNDKISDLIVGHVVHSRKQYEEAKAKALLSDYDPIEGNVLNKRVWEESVSALETQMYITNLNDFAKGSIKPDYRRLRKAEVLLCKLKKPKVFE